MKTIILSAIALCLLFPEAEAQTSYSLSKVCKLDIDQYCRDIRKTRTRDLKACLAGHEKDLFPQCQDHYKQAR